MKVGDVIGILRTTVNLDSLAHSLAAGSFGETGQTVLYLPDRQELTLKSNEQMAHFQSYGRIQSLTSTFYQPINSDESYFEITHGNDAVLASQARAVIAG